MQILSGSLDCFNLAYLRYTSDLGTFIIMTLYHATEMLVHFLVHWSLFFSEIYVLFATCLYYSFIKYRIQWERARQIDELNKEKVSLLFLIYHNVPLKSVH